MTSVVLNVPGGGFTPTVTPTNFVRAPSIVLSLTVQSYITPQLYSQQKTIINRRQAMKSRPGLGGAHVAWQNLLKIAPVIEGEEQGLVPPGRRRYFGTIVHTPPAMTIVAKKQREQIATISTAIVGLRCQTTMNIPCPSGQTRNVQ